MLEPIAIKRIRCPRCKCSPDELVEVWVNSTLSFSIENDQRSIKGFLGAGDPDHVNAICSCGHVWRLRKVLQITDVDLEVYLESEPPHAHDK